MNYQETEQKIILREIEKDLLAMVAVNLNTSAYEVIYSDGAYRHFGNRFGGKDFFAVWQNEGRELIAGEDQPGIFGEISREHLREVFRDNDSYTTKCRFLVNGVPSWCRIRVIRNPVEPETVVIGIHNIDEELRQEMDHRSAMEEMRMKNCVSQMNPHFLYNALSSIREIVLTDPEFGADMLYDFTTHLRASIRALSNDGRIWFSQELENIRAYVNIEKMRFGDRLQVDYEISAADFQILPLTIQPIVENAVRHGLYEKEDEGTVQIRTRELPDCFEICVRDNGIGFDPDEVLKEVAAGRRDSTGLKNLAFRLEKMMHATVDVKSRRGEGTAVTVRIPKDRGAC